MMEERQRNAILTDLAAWIDPFVIAEAIISHAEEEHSHYLDEIPEVNLAECQQIWLNKLQELF